MRKKLLSLLAMVLVTITASAQWTKPTVENVFTAVEPESGQTYMIYNVVTGRFLTANEHWGTHAALKPGTYKNKTSDYPCQFELTYKESPEDLTVQGWTFFLKSTIINSGGSALTGKYTFRADATGVYLDMGSQGNNYWDLRPQGDNIYRIQANEGNTAYGAQIIKDGEKVDNENYAKEYFGWGGENDGAMRCYGNVDPAKEGVGLDWAFIDPATYDDLKAANEAAIKLYEARVPLYEQAQICIAENLAAYNVDYTAYTEIYNGTDVEAIKAAANELAAKVVEARKTKAWATGSEDNPSDVTFLLLNADMSGTRTNDSNGKSIPDGWTVSVPNAHNYGYQSNQSYTNDIGDAESNKNFGVKIDGFIEAWLPTNNGGLGNGKICQTVELPMGKYVLGVDVMATDQTGTADDYSEEGGTSKYLVTGLQPYALGGGIDNGVSVNSLNGKPEHFEFEFVTAGGETELGLRMINATANWFGADNFTIKYKGNDFDPYMFALPGLVESLKETYDNMGDVRAHKDSIDNFEQAYVAAQGVLGTESADFEGIYTTLFNANTALKNSIADYEEFKSILEKWTEKSERAALAGDKWSNVSAQIVGKINTYTDYYNDGTYTREQIGAVDNELGVFYAEEIGKLVSKGDDISFLLENAGFDGTLDGWTIDADAYTNSKGSKVQLGGYPVTFTDAEGAEVTLNSAVCEVWRNSFCISQVIKNMPAGLYTLSAQAFVRNEDNQNSKDVGGEFFAVMGEDVQTATLKSIQDHALAEAYSFTPGTGAVGTEADADRGFGFVPNGRCGANVRFALGQYKNFFDIEMKEIGDIEVGVRCADINFWCLFDDFKIVYKGNDAEAYQETIERLASKIQDMENDVNALWTNEAYEKCEQALKAAQQFIENIKSKTTDDALAMRDQLEGAIADAEASLAKTAELKALWTEYSEYRMNPMDYDGDPDDDKYLDLITNTLANLVGDGAEDMINTDAEVLTYMDQIVKGYAPYLQSGYTKASKANPNNLTAVITNPDCMGYGNGVGEAVGAEGWEVTVGKVGTGSDGGDTPNGNGSVIEFFQTDFDIHQTIYGLKPGYYELGVSGFYRDGNVAHIDSCMNHYDGKSENRYVKLYADSKQKDLLVISEEAAYYTMFLLDSGDEKLVDGEGKASSKNGTIKYVVGEGDDPETEEYYIPNTIYAAQAAFDAELYQNKLVFQIKEEQESVTIGLRKEHNGNIEANEEEGIEAYSYYDWTPFNYWTLAYWGTELPDHIQGVEVQKTVAKDVIYNIAGQRVQKAVKGLYIINGKKVLVK